MTPENFCYWFQGYLEIADSKDLDSNQLDIVKDHLKLVFNKVTPDRDMKDLARALDSFQYHSTPICSDGIVFDQTPQLSIDYFDWLNIPPGASC